MRALVAFGVMAVALGAALAQPGGERAAIERRIEEACDAARAELSADIAHVAPSALADRAAVRALAPARRAAVERLLDVVERTPDNHLRHVAVDLESAEMLALPEFAARLADVRLVGVGETHTAPADHALQQAMVELLAGHPGRTAVGLEMLARPHQDALDRYAAGKLSEADFLTGVDWKTSWGFDWTLYAGIFRAARARGLPIVALNLPHADVRAVSKVGLEALPKDARDRLPAEIDLGQAAHRARVTAALGAHAHGPASPERLERMYQAMCVWDEAMADRAAGFLAAHADVARIVVLAGRGHVENGDGIPARAARRGVASWAVVLPRAADGGHVAQLRADLLRPPARYVVFVAP